ncbi:spermidine/putrescine ABC transporter permease [Halobellus salinus]|uniref:Spermidine/putrescine ABC transporter permease n=1 Tax=Halobellus salinus TaxID=931585 RepID=A0A830EDC9_9EURY|nr:ABC transporter permease [Halobellus salinus]GGJ01013.1 spermidine/putrescine ABC transporter permease [Halobellus salinus]SMP00799.1 spermidine/putrescine transport system permease protein [Halobellus salinus]
MSTRTLSFGGRSSGWIWYGYVTLVALFLMIPLVSLVIASFYDGRFFSIVDYQFTLGWYNAALSSGSIRRAFTNTLFISVPVTVLSTIIGTAAALAYTRYEFPYRESFKLIALLPIFFPLILLGLGMSMWASQIGLGYGLVPSIIGELVWISPIVMFVVSITALGIDPNTEEAARDLGADTLTLYRRVLFPLVADGVVSGAIFAFVLSWNNYYIVSYLSGPQSTITTWIHGRMTQGFTPVVPAVASLIFYVSILLVVGAIVIEYRKDDTGE